MTPKSPSSSTAAWTAHDLTANPHTAPDKADKVQRMFAAIAQRYDLNNRIHSFGRDQAWRREAVRLCNVQPTDSVLDVACGTGDFAEAFAAAGAAKVVGIDFTERMLQLAREKSCCQARLNESTMPQYQRGDALNLQFNNRSFDIVSIAFGIRNLSDPERALHEFHRVLRPNGRLLVLEFSQPRSRMLRMLNHMYCSHIMPFTASLIAGDRSGAYHYLPRSIETFYSPDEFEDLLRRNNFVPEVTRPMTFGVCCAFLATPTS